MTSRLLFTAIAIGIFSSGCAVPADIEEGEASTDNALVTGGGGACPVDARISQGFSGSHDGIDLANSIGTPIYAVMGGTVTASGPAQGYGQWIRIKHGDGSMTEYGHMSKRLVQVGATVKAGQKIAQVGSEGESTGPHLHLRTYRSASKVGSGNGMNPVEYLKARGVSLPCKPNGIVTAPTTTPDEDNEDPVTSGSDAPTSAAGTVTTWTDANVRSAPSLSAAILTTAADGASLPATCWIEGDTVTSGSYSHDFWVQVQANGKSGYISGVFLTGDQTGGISTPCE